MMETPQAYPLQWPTGRPRTKYPKQSSFRQNRKPLTVATARQRLIQQASTFGVANEILSTNVELRLDGQPKSNRLDPIDTGVCFFFDLKGKPHAMPCDTFDTVADNIAAIAATIEAQRKIDRYGVVTAEEAFQGFAAITAPGSRDWRSVLGVKANASPDFEPLKARYKELAKRKHPDTPSGSTEAMLELNQAFDKAKLELGFE